MDGTSVLGILLLKLSIILLKFFLFLFHRLKLCLHYVIHVLSIKLINNPFVSIVSKVMNHLNLFTLMCGVLLVILELMDQDITLFFVDHYTKYIWFYLMVTKSGVSKNFPQFKRVFETCFQKSSKTLYSDNGGEFIALKSYLLLHGITHYTTTPHTPQQNGVSERRHRHLFETGLTLIHDAHLDFSYWPYAFQTDSYLINRQPTPFLQEKSPFEVLFGQTPNYLKLKKFGCISYPLTRPYNSNKMQPKSKACLFLGYSPTQNTYKCLEPQTKKNFFSRHVLIDETQDQSSLSQHGSSVLTKKPLDPPPFLPLFFGAHQFAVPSSLAPGAPTSLQPSEGSPAIVAASSSTFGPSSYKSPPISSDSSFR